MFCFNLAEKLPLAQKTLLGKNVRKLEFLCRWKAEELIELKEVENEQTELTDVERPETSVITSVAFGICGECRKDKDNNMGRIDENDGNWYCNECWESFYE